jgi:hypothetical protein
MTNGEEETAGYVGVFLQRGLNGIGNEGDIRLASKNRRAKQEIRRGKGGNKSEKEAQQEITGKRE